MRYSEDDAQTIYDNMKTGQNADFDAVKNAFRKTTTAWASPQGRWWLLEQRRRLYFGVLVLVEVETVKMPEWLSGGGGCSLCPCTVRLRLPVRRRSTTSADMKRWYTRLHE
jgi:radical SAM superfamily enzyme with C-terminal helix-hairpin-helix motif